ncbi:class I SAM-dependent methyltransferase [Rhizobium rhizogenes]|uniref:TylF/MycF/NovP-related O-methyltransferase n=1 Tax=Rhizobium rhizogenes TaxID=359 RepID=UPI001572F5A2|nr:TylF/MycF/NovP-related O-methyltransferase [Rhizobium rhizogenes]NTI24878.1 class I SAM-dependent methyltransferase [Rhizobium rhizogenes]QTG08597.1 class I SAM-dependent methyltransferase [Rhizobium rhizogenes]
MQTHYDDSTRTLDDIAVDLQLLAANLDHRHRQQRKIQFLLDIRGYLMMNSVAGNYAEFGIFRGEMMYNAHHILGHLGLLRRYLGFDNFAGEPSMTPEEQSRLPFITEGDYKANEVETRAFLEKHIGAEKLEIIVGDFRDPVIHNRMPNEPVAVGVIDCNLPSSIESALNLLLPQMSNGAALFLDDYFLNITANGFWHEEALSHALSRHRKRLVYFQTYAPCAQSFFVFDNHAA